MNSCPPALSRPLVSEGQPAGEQGHFPIAVTNYGSRPVLDVAFDTARFDEFPNSIPTIDETKRKATVLDSDRNAHTFYLAFVDEAKGAVLQGTRNQHGNWHQEEVDLSKVNAWVTLAATHQGVHAGQDLLRR